MKGQDPAIGCFDGLTEWGRQFTKRRCKLKNRDNAGSSRQTPQVQGQAQGSKTKEYCPEWVMPCEPPPSYSTAHKTSTIPPDAVHTVENKIDELNPVLRKLSLQIHDHPEIGFKERYTHDTLTAFMESYGFTVTRHYLGLETAWRAEYTSGIGGHVVGVNAEMDSLPGIGHACGHNLIAVAGVGVAIGLQAALKQHNISGKVILLGTPGEEGGGGKQILLDRGGYKEMDACLMCHPAPGPARTAAISPLLAMQSISVEYFGQAAHAAAAPWEGVNALDAAFLAYSNISVLRQQIKPTHRVHGIVEGKNWSPGVIPDYAKLRYMVRAPTWGEVVELRGRLKACFEGAALATSCECTIEFGPEGYREVQQNRVLAQDFADVIGSRYNVWTDFNSEKLASTDFGSVSHALPSLHPSFTIPSPDGGNHTPAFTKAARTMEAHEACMTITKGIALNGLRLLCDDDFLQKVKEDFDGNS